MKSSCKLSLESNNKAYEMFSPGDQCNASWEISQVTWQCNFNGLRRESNYGDTISISKKWLCHLLTNTSVTEQLNIWKITVLKQIMLFY